VSCYDLGIATRLNTFHVTASLLAVACTLAAGAAAATRWAVYRDTVNQVSIATPAKWVRVPGSRAAALRLIASLRKRGETRQATLVRWYMDDNSQSGEDRIVDGIQYPIRTSPILTDFVLVKSRLPKSLKSDPATLDVIAKAIFVEFLKDGSRMTTGDPVKIRLPAGRAEVLSGAVTAAGFGGRKTGFAIYILLGPGRTEWQIQFRTDSRQLDADGPLFRRIADSLRLG
jgi:hypothetical protein